MGIHSPTWELEGKKKQENQISDWEDIEAGDKDPLIIISEEEIYDTQGRCTNKNPHTRRKSPRRKRGVGSRKGPARKE